LRRPTAFALTAACLHLLLLLTTNVPLQAREKDKPKDYALIFGTVWGPDNVPIHGIEVSIRRADEKKPKWHVSTNGRGEFEQRVPVGKADYIIWADSKGVKLPNGKHLQASPQVTVHVDSNEREDTGLHLK
jgi:hypothetical protein